MRRGFFTRCLFTLSLCLIYVNDVKVNAAITLISHLRRQELDENDHNMERIENAPNNKESEPGFALEENEIKKFHIWSNGIIPYYIDDYSFDKVLRDTIRAFLEHTNLVTGIRFLELASPPKDDSRWVFFINRKALLGCADHSFDSFSNEGVQKVILGYDCINTENGLSEVILLLLGVPPQHNAPNRDDFIEIKKDNVMREYRDKFTLLNNDEWLFHDLEYDYKSAGHYGTHKYTSNGKATIIPKTDAFTSELGHGKCLSSIDVKKIKMLYSYIAKENTVIGLPECKKLFSPGSNFDKYKHQTKGQRKPRNKPNKYLGLPDDVPEEATQDLVDENASNIQEHKEEKNDEPIDENLDIKTDVIPEEEIQKENNDELEKVNTDVITEETIHKAEERDGKVNVSKKGERNKSKLSMGSKGQKLLDLSDFATEEKT
ncbi:unnamed protein product [Leptosia nina]|uniref:Metalloendopeptidase n=1 Tax=Leptosia nina TaxID=320188 RepID=A0AAV1JNL9_9NEOP